MQRPSPQRITAIRTHLLDWYREQARDLPWRQTSDPYRIWLSEIMLQQTRVDQVVPYYERFVEAFPDVEALAAAGEEAVLKAWEGMGYYRRALNLHKASKHVVEALEGRFPGTAQELQDLPGVGRYTAGAIASIAFGEKAPVLDGNVKRVLARLFCVEDSIDETLTQEAMWRTAEALVPENEPGDFNQAVMELGATVCTPRNPRCLLCPLRSCCDGFKAGKHESLPVRRAHKPVPHQAFLVAAIRRNSRYLIGRRPSTGLLGGLWEMPCFERPAEEEAAKALGRLVREGLGLRVNAGEESAEVDHVYSHLRVTLTVFSCTWLEGTPASEFYTAFKWAYPSTLGQYAFPKAAHKYLACLWPGNSDFSG